MRNTKTQVGRRIGIRILSTAAMTNRTQIGMACDAGSGIDREGWCTVRLEIYRVRAHSTPDSQTAMTYDAITFRMAACTSVHRPTRLDTVSPFSTNPDRRGRMVALRGMHFRRTQRREPESGVAFSTEAADLMTRGATWIIASSFDHVGSQIISRVNSPWPNTSIMAVGAVRFYMASCTYFPLIGSHPAVTYDPLPIMSHIEKPRGRIHMTLGKAHS